MTNPVVTLDRTLNETLTTGISPADHPGSRA